MSILSTTDGRSLSHLDAVAAHSLTLSLVSRGLAAWESINNLHDQVGESEARTSPQSSSISHMLDTSVMYDIIVIEACDLVV